MPLALQSFFDQQALAYGEGRIDDIVAVYDVPLAVYNGSEILLRQTPADVHALISSMMEVAARYGTERLVPEIRGTRGIEGGRLPVTVEWHYLDAMDAEITSSVATYYCRLRKNGRVIIEMVEYQKPAFPDSMGNAPESLRRL